MGQKNKNTSQQKELEGLTSMINNTTHNLEQWNNTNGQYF